ncbi:hypothetical protein EV641_11432 [Rhodococcus sp. SMB37]|uniref:hypothetical protein n=1 Tax=Rhodococcus sp. SMB37 TaxID=2512213 RepID=UPI0006D0B9BF|nr:hypothetical protein [Rhodococcus sp. SMB37]TCN49749.1 hypothetical protein EV641_11432 [Rhodococcus sp. SMB37]
MAEFNRDLVITVTECACVVCLPRKGEDEGLFRGGGSIEDGGTSNHDHDNCTCTAQIRDDLVLLVAASVACIVITLKIVGFVESGIGGTGVAETVVIVAAVAVVPAVAYAQRRGTTLAATLVWFTGAPFFSIGIFLLVLSVVPDELADIPGYATIGAVLMLMLGLIAGRTLHSMLGRHRPADQVSVNRYT